MFEKIVIVFLLFIIYSVIGWCMEVILIAIDKKKFVDRGFLIGPYCPIYGYGALIMVYALERYREDPIALFVMSVVCCSILEYVTSYAMEKLFKARWWDYSTRKFNLNGRICLLNSILFGVLASLIVYIVNPFVVDLITKVNINILSSVAIILFVVYIFDNIISLNIMSKLKTVAYEAKNDNTEEITKRVKEVISQSSKLGNRLINAFPNFKSTIKSKKEELLEKKEELTRKINEKIEAQKLKFEKQVEQVRSFRIKK